MLDQLDDEGLERLVQKRKKERELAQQQKEAEEKANQEVQSEQSQEKTTITTNEAQPPTTPPPPPPNNEEEEENSMSFLGHLEVLRWHLMRSVIAIFIFTIAAALLMKSYIFPEIIIAPTKLNFWTYQQLCELSNLLNTDALCIKKLGFTIQSRKLPAQFTTHIRASLVIGFIAAFPYVFWEIWRFIKPALYTKEQIMAKSTVFFVSLLFFMGVAFGYYLILPLSLNFLGNYQLDPNILNEIDLGNYISTIISIILAAGIMFQLPMLSLFFSKIGLLTPQFLMNYRKHSVVVILFISAILTPPDVASQLLLSVPLFLLYEVSIQISKYVTKNNKI